MITKEGLMVIEDGKFFLYGFHFEGSSNFEDMRRDMIFYVENILTEENFVPVNTVNVSDEYQESGIRKGVAVMSRPEYVHCVGFGDAINAIRSGGQKTWCGVDHGAGEPFFVDIDHAAFNGRNKGRLVVCGECRHKIIEALSNGCDYL